MWVTPGIAVRALLNIGCGNRIAGGWTNLDFTSTSSAVLAHDLNRGIPFPDSSFDLVYHSHLLEHLGREAGAALMRECHRVLKPCGIVRVVVPDLELLSRRYLDSLARARAGTANAAASHEWAVIHLIDQMVRHRSGGEMLRYAARSDLVNFDEVVAAWGSEALLIRNAYGPAAAGGAAGAGKGLMARIGRVARGGHVLDELRARILGRLLGRRANAAMRLGQFRLSGEAHQWMYDAYSLAHLLEAVGFVQVQQHSATSSDVEDWRSFHLDTEADGTVYRPDSLYMEARRAVPP